MKPLSGLEQGGEFNYVPPRRGLSGWIRKDLPEGLLADFIPDPEAFFREPSVRFLKKGSKSQVVQHTLTAGEGKAWEVIIKRVQYRALWRRLCFFLLPSPAVRSLRSAVLLKAWGILTPPPLAALEWRDWRRVGTSYYFVEEVEASQSLPTLWMDAPPTFSRKEVFKEKRRILRSLATLFHRLHSRGIYHQDLKAGNILIRNSGSDGWLFYLIDIDGVRKCRRLSWFKRVKNLVQMYRTFGEHLSVNEKAVFLKYYSDLFSLPVDRRKAIAGKVLSGNKKWRKSSLRQRAKEMVEGWP